MRPICLTRLFSVTDSVLSCSDTGIGELKATRVHRTPCTCYPASNGLTHPSSLRFESSSLFDNVHGFGGNGVPGTYTLPPDPNGELEIPNFPGNPPANILWNGCVQTGPFRDAVFRLNVGPGRMMTDHCITRNFNPTSWKSLLTSASVASALAPTDFWDFNNVLNPGPHLGGHAIFGGVMSNTFSTAGGMYCLSPLSHDTFTEGRTL